MLHNYPSWQKDDDAKRALEPVIAKWFASGVLEFLAERCPLARGLRRSIVSSRTVASRTSCTRTWVLRTVSSYTAAAQLS